MTSRDFCFWLQGMFELGQPTALNEATTAAIKAHLALVFVYEIDPSMGPPAHQAKLNEVHAPAKPVVPTADALAPTTSGGWGGPTGGPLMRC